MKRALVLVAFLFASVAAVQPAQAQFGFAGGLNFDDIGDIDAGSAEGTHENATGYHFGIFYDLSVGPLALRPGIFYRDIGTYEINADVVEEFDVSLIEVPVDLRYRLTLPVLKPYILGGPVLSLPQGEDDFGDNGLEDIALSANVGVGIELSPPGASLKIMPELRYAFGLTNYIKDEFEIGGREIIVEDEQRLSSIMLRLNVAF